MTGFLSLGVGPGSDVKRFITLGLEIGEPWLDKPSRADLWIDQQVDADSWDEEPAIVTSWTDI